MSLNRTQFRELIIRVLRDFDPNLLSPQAVNLLLGTAAVESNFGTFLRQVGSGPALGIFQMEPETFRWLQDHYKQKYPELANRRIREVEWDLRLAIIFARLRYRIVPAPLPDSDDILALARYWKKYYNTDLGAGTVNQFIANYGKFVGG